MRRMNPNRVVKTGRWTFRNRRANFLGLLTVLLSFVWMQTAISSNVSNSGGSLESNKSLQRPLKILKSLNNPLDARKEAAAMILELRDKKKDLDPQAKEQLLKVLDAPTDKQARLAVINALSEMDSPYNDFVQPLFNILLTGDPDLQTATQGILSRYRDKKLKVPERLLEIANDPKKPLPQRVAVIETLGKFRDKAIVGALIRLMETASTVPGDRNEIQNACAKSLKNLTRADYGVNPAEWKHWWNINSSRSTVQWLENQLDVVINENRDLKQRLEQTETEVVNMAIQLFRVASPNEADRIKVVQTYLAGAVPAQRRAGLELLTTFISPKQPIPPALKPAIRDLIDDPDPQVRKACAKALGESGDHESLDSIRKQLKVETDDEVKKSILVAIGQLGDRTQLDVLIQQLNSDSEQISVGSAQALANIFQNQKKISEAQKDQVINALRDRYKRTTDEQPLLKQEMIRAMGIIHDFRFHDTFEYELLNNPTPLIRLFAARGLANLNDDKDYKLLADQLKDSDPGVRAEVATGIASLTCDPEAVKTLLTRTNPNFEKDNQVRLRTWDAILVMIKRWPLDQQLKWANDLSMQKESISREQMAALAEVIGNEINEETTAYPPDRKAEILIYFGKFLLENYYAEDSVKYFRQAISTSKQLSPEKPMERADQIFNIYKKTSNCESSFALYLSSLAGLLEPDQVESIMTTFLDWAQPIPNHKAAAKVCYDLSPELLNSVSDSVREKLEDMAKTYNPQTSPARSPSTGTGPS